MQVTDPKQINWASWRLVGICADILCSLHNLSTLTWNMCRSSHVLLLRIVSISFCELLSILIAFNYSLNLKNTQLVYRYTIWLIRLISHGKISITINIIVLLKWKNWQFILSWRDSNAKIDPIKRKLLQYFTCGGSIFEERPIYKVYPFRLSSYSRDQLVISNLATQFFS